MVEAAYVLPLVVGVILFIVEAVAYAMSSIAVNDVLTDVHSRITTEVFEASRADSFAEVSALYPLVSCTGGGSAGKVTLNSGQVISQSKGLLNSYFEQKSIALSKKPEVTVDGPTTVEGFDVYIIKYTATAAPIVFPEFLSGLLPMSVNTVISVKDRCTP